MLLTREFDYGLRVIRSLADGEKKSGAEICSTEILPVSYGYKILKKLENAGILLSTRGQYGGYQLAKSLENITLYDIILALNESFLVFQCLEDRTMCPFLSENRPCGFHIEFQRIQDMLVEGMREKSMYDLVKNEKTIRRQCKVS